MLIAILVLTILNSVVLSIVIAAFVWGIKASTIEDNESKLKQMKSDKIIKLLRCLDEEELQKAEDRKEITK